MVWKRIVLCFCAVVALSSAALDFPPGFQWGAATAAYQVEGAWNASDKSPSIWDWYVHSYPEEVEDGSDGDVASDSYNQYMRDVEITQEMGLHFYRFSISWSRLLPSGFTERVSEAGARYYGDLIDALLLRGVQPVITLYHWDLPYRLHTLGGWTNPLVADWFADYARVVFRLYGDRVKLWITLNEPVMVCGLGYGSTQLAPGVNDSEVAMYMCNKHVLLAHAKAYRVYAEEFRSQYNGKVSMANHFIWLEPKTPEEQELTDLARQYFYGRYCHPIWSKEGGWPASVENRIRENSLKQGYNSSRLPAFTKEEVELVRGTADFLSLNHYTSRKVSYNETPGEWLFFGAQEINANFESDPDWPQTSSFWFTEYPEGLRKMLQWLKQEYGDIDILISENGYASAEADLQDDRRTNYYKTYLEQVHKSINEDKVNIFGYTAWSLLDNFEWMSGYTSRFGLYSVNFTDPSRPRAARDSAKYYARVIKANSLDVPLKED